MVRKQFPVNERIRAKEVRVIDESGQQLGVMSLFQALERAREKDLDLVLVAPGAKPPVCRITDYGRFKYEMLKKEKELRKGQRTAVVIKELKLSPKILDHDLRVRISQAQKFLKKGYKVKVTMRFRGREITHPQIGRRIVDQLVAEVREFGVVEQPPKLEGKNMILILTPK